MAKLKPEIERRLLLWDLPGPEIFEAPYTKLLHYHTLYLCHDDPEFRLRKVVELNRDIRYKMAVKEGEEGEERGETLIDPINGERLFLKNLGILMWWVRRRFSRQNGQSVGGGTRSIL